MQIKLQIGKLTLNLPLPQLIENQCQTNGLQLLSIETSHIYALNNLPPHHKDPFDRILIAQAIVEQIAILSIDEIFDNYPIQRLW
jgi:PIN domain nuclease of toxin-antitoxin system